MIDFKELDELALKVIDNNQKGFSINEVNMTHLYTLAFNDGVLSFLSKIKDNFAPLEPKKFDPEEAADGQD